MVTRDTLVEPTYPGHPDDWSDEQWDHYVQWKNQPPPPLPVLTDIKQDEYNVFQRIRQDIESARRLL